VTPKLELGLNGYYLKQLTETEINEAGVPGRSERVLGIGAGTVFTLRKNNLVFQHLLEDAGRKPARRRPFLMRASLLGTTFSVTEMRGRHVGR
jgi:hypothetical protein